MLKKLMTVAVITVMLSSNVYAYSGASAWAENTLEKASNANIVPDNLLNSNVSNVIRKGECASVCVKFYETLSKKTLEIAQNPFTDTVSDEVLKAVSLGIVGTFSGESFSENSVACREEIADMMAKTYAKVSGEEAVIDNKVAFSDDEFISKWAKESVYFIQDKGIIHIVGSNKFAPRNINEDQTRANYANMTIQNVLISFVRMFEMLDGSDTEKDTNNQGNIGELCLRLIPQIDFGTAEAPVSGTDTASITVKNVNQQDFYDYIEKTKHIFPEVIYVLEGKNYKAWDGEYTINIVYENSILTVEVFKN